MSDSASPRASACFPASARISRNALQKLREDMSAAARIQCLFMEDYDLMKSYSFVHFVVCQSPLQRTALVSLSPRAASTPCVRLQTQLRCADGVR
eukprot:scaffold4372_cov397-Prasinococcus_capsulatus_cf.AAC.32